MSRMEAVDLRNRTLLVLGLLPLWGCGEPATECMAVPANGECPSAAEASDTLLGDHCGYTVNAVTGEGELTEVPTWDTGAGQGTREECCYPTLEAVPVGTSCVVGRPYIDATGEKVAPARSGRGWARGRRPDVRRLTAAERAVLAAAWTEDALVEHASVAAFARTTLELMALGAPAELLAGAQAAAADEVRHARLSFALASAYAGREVEPAGFLRKRFAHVAWLRREFTWSGAHDLAAAVWRVLGPLLTVWNLPVAVGLIGMGAYAAWIDQRVDPTSLADRAPLLALAVVGHVVLHELAHAVAVVGFGRRVRGMAIGLRGAYVDTTDMYLGTRAQHAVVALAGPGTSLLLAALAATVACALPVEAVALPRAFAAVGLGITLLTGWPFLLDNDGAHALGDLIGTPHVRTAAWRALRTGKVRPVHTLYLMGCVLTALAPPLVLLLRA